VVTAARVHGTPAPVGGGPVGTGFDVLLHDTALVFWTTSDVSSLHGPCEAMPLLRRLVGSLLTSNADPRSWPSI